MDNSNFGNDPANPDGEQDYNVEATHACKHCDALGMECPTCEGTGFFDAGATFTSVRNELRRTGTDVNNNTLSVAVKELVVYGFLTKEGAEGYKAVDGMKVNVVKKSA